MNNRNRQDLDLRKKKKKRYRSNDLRNKQPIINIIALVWLPLELCILFHLVFPKYVSFLHFISKVCMFQKEYPKQFWFIKVDLYDLVIFDHFWPSDWSENRDEF